MALSNISATIGGVLKSVRAWSFPDGSVAFGRVAVDTDGNPTGKSDNPVVVAPNGGIMQVAASGSFNEAGIQGVTAIGTPGRGVILIVTAAGNVDFTFADGSLLASVPVTVGLNVLPFSVTAGVASSAGGAALAQVKGAK